jgi:hypothetical protein
MAVANPSASSPTPPAPVRFPDHIARREIERHVLRRIRRLDDAGLVRLLAELRGISTQEPTHA